MLSKKQRTVLKIILDNSINSGSCLLSAELISAFSSSQVKLSVEETKKVVESLSARGYLEVINTFKKGEPYYCINLTAKGRGYMAEYREEIKDIRFKLLITALGAVVSFIIGRILFAIFS